MSQSAEVNAIQLALDIAEREKWPEQYLHTDPWMVTNTLLEWLQQYKQSNCEHRRNRNCSAVVYKHIATWGEIKVGFSVGPLKNIQTTSGWIRPREFKGFR